MEKLTRLFVRSIRFAYHCFDRIVIRGYLSTLSRPENIEHFFRNIKQVEVVGKETLRQRTDEYLSWVNAYAQKHEIPIVWAEKDVRKKDDLAPLRARMQREGRTGVYYVLKSMEQGPSFRIVNPKYPVKDPTWRIIAPQRSRYTHLYFYIIDDELGPFSMRIGAYLPFYATYYLNGHDLIAPILAAEGVRFCMNDNAFVKQYEKDNTFLRIETCSNNLKDFRQKKALEHLPEVAEKLQAVNDRFADAQAENLNVEMDYPLLEELAQPCRLKTQRMAGIHLENDRIIRLLEVLMHSSGHLGGQTAADIHQAVLQAHQLTPAEYTRNQLAYDLRKLRAHGLIERPDNRYVYVLSNYGRKAAAMLVIVRNRILRPIAGSLFVRSPKPSLKPHSKIQAQYRRTSKSFNELIALLKAA